MPARTLPDFEHPPAVETALGLRFAAIKGWSVFHYGSLLQHFKREYPKQELRPPIGDVTFNFPPTGTDFSVIPVRCWFINADDTQLIQVQNNCFIRNWRRTEQTPDYLHYDVIRPLFRRDWQKFLGFLDAEGLSRPEVWQCEVTYVNQFLRGREWRDFNDLSDLYPSWQRVRSGSYLAKAEMIAFTASYGLPTGNGSLQFASQPGVRTDGTEIIQLTVTALGKPAGSDEESILKWLDDGRAAVVSGFTEFTSSKMHTLWGRK